LYAKYNFNNKEEEILEIETFENILSRKLREKEIFIDSESDLDTPYDCLKYIDPIFIIRPSLLQKTLEFPFRVPKKVSHTNSYIRLFEAAKLCAYNQMASESLKYLSRAYKIDPCSIYTVWEIMLKIKYPKLIETSSVSCCESRKRSYSTIGYLNLYNRLKDIPSSIETLWLSMFMSLEGKLEKGTEIEPWQYYAREILLKDKYYGYLAWGVCYLYTQRLEGEHILLEIVSRFPDHPDPYIILWEHYWKKHKFDNAFEIIAQAFLKVTDEKFDCYCTLIHLLYSKSLCRTNKHKTALELLQRIYVEKPRKLRFLYQFGKNCIKFKLPKFQITGLGALVEIERTVKNYPKLYYWLGKACLSLKRIIKAQRYFTKATISLDFKETPKILNSRKKIEKIEQSLEKFEDFKKNLANNHIEPFENISHDDLTLIRLTKIAYAKYLIASGDQMKALYFLQEINTIETFKLLIKHICVNLPFEASNEILYAALHKLRASLIPTYEFVSACSKYAKFLNFHKKSEKSILILKSLLKLYPSWKINSDYFKNIKKAESAYDLLNENFNGTINYYDYSFARDFIFDCIELKKTTADDFLYKKKSFHKKNELSVQSSSEKHIQKDNLLDKLKQLKINKNWVSEFSVYTNPKIFLQLGKVASGVKKYKSEAITILNDFLLLSTKTKHKQQAQRILIQLTNELYK
jgi:hypothetical protein